jgi:hypothetical protein
MTSPATTGGAPSLAELSLAFRQSKLALWSEKRSMNLFALAKYEENLYTSLRALQRKLRNQSWFDKLDVGTVLATPKQQRNSSLPEGEGTRIGGPSTPPEELTIRVQLWPSLDYLVTEVLYLWKFGAILDSVLGPASVGYRLDLRRADRTLSRTRRQIFQYWPKSYQRFRRASLRAARRILRRSDPDTSCILATADLSSFYDNVDPSFLLSDDFDNELTSSSLRRGIPYDRESYRTATLSLLRSYRTYWSRVSRATGLPATVGLPIGPLVARVIANVCLSTLDRHIAAHEDIVSYRRYVDDLILVARSPPPILSRLDYFRRWLPVREASTDTLVLDSLALHRAGSRLALQPAKMTLHHLTGLDGLDFVNAVETDLDRLSSESRIFADADLLGDVEKLPLLKAASKSGSRLRVLRDADRTRLELFSLANAMRTFERAAKLLDRQEARELIKRAVEPISRVLKSDDRWIDNLEAALRLLSLVVLVGDEPTARELIRQMDVLWDPLLNVDGGGVTLKWNGRLTVRPGIRTALANYLRHRRLTAIASTYPLSGTSSLGPLMVKNTLIGDRAIRSRALRLARIDARFLDREEEFSHSRRTDYFDLSTLEKHLQTDDAFNSRLNEIDRFTADTKRLENGPWGIPALVLFLSTRPPSYFDVSRRLLYRADTSEIDADVFTRIIRTVNALRGTDYWRPIGRVDASDVVIVGGDLAPHTPETVRVILGNLTLEPKWWGTIAKGQAASAEKRRRIHGVGRLRELARVLEKAERATHRSRMGAGQDGRSGALLILPELALPRQWLREIAQLVGRSLSFGLTTGL